MKVLLTGATGYIGGKLLPELESKGYDVTCLARNRSALTGVIQPTTRIIEGDVLDPERLNTALDGIHTAYYLIHSMGTTGSFQDADRMAAENFARLAKTNGVSRIIYLGGLGRDSDGLSEHLRSRQEVGEILRSSGIPVVEFRASIVIGAGSLSFEMIRSLVNKLPVMITPKWVSVKAQPIGIDDLIAYLLHALKLDKEACQIYEIGGPDQVSYREIMQLYAEATQRTLRMIPVPVLTPYLSSLWLGLVTPLYARIGKKLIESIVNATVVRDHRARDVFSITPVGARECVARALSDNGSAFNQPEIQLSDTRTSTVALSCHAAFKPIQHIGGKNGWYAWNGLWKTRGMIDRLVGGVGMRSGRPSSTALSVGDTIDFWKVIEYQPDHQLRLAAQMKLPGKAHLEFRVDSAGAYTTITQTAYFKPSGLLGRFYWYALYPVHHLVFSGMLKGITHTAYAERAP